MLWSIKPQQNRSCESLTSTNNKNFKELCSTMIKSALQWIFSNKLQCTNHDNTCNTIKKSATERTQNKIEYTRLKKGVMIQKIPLFCLIFHPQLHRLKKELLADWQYRTLSSENCCYNACIHE